MQKRVFKIIAFCLAAALFGCSVISGDETDVEQPTLETAPVKTPAPDPTPEPTVGEDLIFVSGTDTPAPTKAPTPTGTPGPTDTPESNPYVGVWTIEDLPFSLELRDDKTYLITVSEKEREGTYAFDTSKVWLSGVEDEPVELQYYTKADVLKIDAFKLIRDDLVFFFNIDGVPISFQNENEDLIVKVRGATVEATVKGDRLICSYCITGAGLTPPENSRDWFLASDSGEACESVCIFKCDGNYTLWVRDTEGALLAPVDMTVDSGFRYPIGGDGIDYLHQPLGRFLRNRETSADELNRSISRDVTAAGFYTRAGAVTAGVSLISALSEYGYAVGYQENGVYQAEQEWGVNPRWGAKLGISEDDSEGDEAEPVGSYTGMNDIACIVWAYKQAGLNLCADTKTPIGALGERELADDNRIDADRAKSGDIIQHGNHCMMVIDRLDLNRDGTDDAYLTFEMVSPLLTMQILPFDKMQSMEVYSMDAFFGGTGRNKGKVKYWQEGFRIPAEALPQYLKETIEAETVQRSFFELIKRLGF